MRFYDFTTTVPGGISTVEWWRTTPRSPQPHWADLYQKLRPFLRVRNNLGYERPDTMCWEPLIPEGDGFWVTPSFATFIRHYANMRRSP